MLCLEMENIVFGEFIEYLGSKNMVKHLQHPENDMFLLGADVNFDLWLGIRHLHWFLGNQPKEMSQNHWKVVISSKNTLFPGVPKTKNHLPWRSERKYFQIFFFFDFAKMLKKHCFWYSLRSSTCFEILGIRELDPEKEISFFNFFFFMISQLFTNSKDQFCKHNSKFDFHQKCEEPVFSNTSAKIRKKELLGNIPFLPQHYL